jgi:hypothetical protein
MEATSLDDAVAGPTGRIIITKFRVEWNQETINQFFDDLPRL